ncbi:hypothetical protein AOLI_G00270090 [Acnodon oligacanthus]
MASEAGVETLYLRHGVRCVPESGVTVEDVLLAVGRTGLTESGIWVKGNMVQVSPLSAPATRVIVSNVPPFIKNEVLLKELARFGKFASDMKMIPLGCKNSAVRHVLSFRRQVFMFLNNRHQSLEVSFRCKHGDGSYIVIASSERLRCFECGDIGHKQFGCPHKAAQQVHLDIDQADTRGDGRGGVAEASTSSGRKAKAKTDRPVREEDEQVIEHLGVIDSSAHEERVGELEGAESESEVESLLSDCSGMSEIPAGCSSQPDLPLQAEEPGVPAGSTRQASDLYSLAYINSFLRATKGKRNVSLNSFFPDSQKFLRSVQFAAKNEDSKMLSPKSRWSGRKADFDSLRQWWDVGKAQIRLFCQQYTSYATEGEQRIIAALERDIARLEQQIGGQDCGGVQAELEELRRDMGAFLLDRAKGALVRARFQLLSEMDAPSSFFFNLEKQHNERQQIYALYMSDGRLSFDVREIQDRTVEFYSDLYKADKCDNDCMDILLADLPKLALDNKDMLDLPLTLEELKAAAFQMSLGRSPGIDEKVRTALREEFQSTKDSPETSRDLTENLQDQIEAEAEAKAVKLLDEEEADNNHPLVPLVTWEPVLQAPDQFESLFDADLDKIMHGTPPHPTRAILLHLSARASPPASFCKGQPSTVLCQ